MKVAICFWGLNRSIEHTIERLEQYLFRVLQDAGVQYKIFLHALILTRPYTNPRANEHQKYLDQHSWSMLHPDMYEIEDQDIVDKTLQLSQYHRQSDPWQTDKISGYIPYSCVDNCIRSLYSLDKVTTMWETSGEQFNAVLYIRPDIRLLQPFRIEWLEVLHPNTIYCPNFHLIDGWNDRLALGIPAVMKHYGHRFHQALGFSTQFPFHSERFLAYTMKQKKIIVEHISFPFWRIRAGGRVHEGDKQIGL